jgi:hypothetical protein
MSFTSALQAAKDAGSAAIAAAKTAAKPALKEFQSQITELTHEAKQKIAESIGCSCAGNRGSGSSRGNWVCDGNTCRLVTAASRRTTKRRSTKKSTSYKRRTAKKSPVKRKSTAAKRKSAARKSATTKRKSAATKRKSTATKRKASGSVKFKYTAKGVQRPSARAMFDDGEPVGTEVTYADGTVKCLSVDRNGRPYFSKC